MSGMVSHYSEDPLWLKLDAMKLDEPGVPVPLSERLAIETGFDAVTIAIACREYKKFLYVAIRCNISPAMPPLADKVWRSHITYTRHYWDLMCAEILEREMHYRRLAELQAEEPDIDHYVQTRQAYERIFGAAPPRSLAAKVPDKPPSTYASWLTALIYFGSFAASVTLAGGVGPFIFVAAFFLQVIGSSLLSRRARKKYHAALRGVDPGDCRDVWEELQTFGQTILGPDNKDLHDRLEKENQWDKDRQGKVIAEYIKFLYIKHVAGHQVTPSPAVDRVWHQHLTYSDHYWNLLCRSVFRHTFHHVPACGKVGEWRKFHDQYMRTLATYEAVFHNEPDSDIWPVSPPVEQQRALRASVFVIAAVLIMAFAVPSINPWLGLFPAALFGAIAGIVGHRWPIDDAAITRTDFASPGTGNFSIEAGGCGGCGGCGG